MFNAILHLKSATPEDFSSSYALISGGEPLSAPVRTGFHDRFGVTLYEGYGLTETSPVISLNSPQSHRAGSVGKPLPGVQTKIADEGGQALGVEQSGEIWFKGPMVMQGYFNLPQETAAALTADGFFKTGDLGKLDADGFLYITGRKKDLIIVAGEKAAPREIEEALLTHPGVAEAAVLGRKDPSRGEVVVAFVISKEGHAPTPEGLREHCRQQSLAPFKIPREVFLVAEFPRSPTGKVLKRVLAEKLDS
jgi:long-chain acyl-CoA synthetase